MTNDRLTIQLRGRDIDNGDVRFDDLIRQLAAVKKSFADMDRLSGNEGKVYYRVVGLSHAGPATLELQAVPIEAEAAHYDAGMNLWYDSVDAIQKQEALPSKLDYPTLQSLKELTPGLGSRIPEMLVKRGGLAVSVSPDLANEVDRILGPHQHEIGSFVGRLEQINLHDVNQFTLYPTSRKRRLTCTFPKELKREAIDALDHYVKVYGRFTYYMNYPQPIEPAVREIQVMPDDADIPSMNDLRGAAPDATGGLPSDEFVRKIRDAW